MLAAGVLADEPLLEPFDVLDVLDELVELLDDDSDVAGLLVLLVPVSEPDDRESVR
ncbi:hypothetical protein [Micromonospora sp. CB01531]|uniref:hypothetical protein n=1 Tax=Micromonospora sp. CB01531 TaxID=1718947 RepID=UPI001F523724|nr:hypothetical protein [Micromonospora sp. CB01531]